MSGKMVMLTEKQFDELTQETEDWQNAAQLLAYLITGVNDYSVADTVKLARTKLTKLFEDMSHDALCWQQVEDDPAVSELIRALASQQRRTLMRDTEGVSQRFLVGSNH